MNLIDDKKVKTINIWNIVEQINDITNIVREGGNSNLSEIQLKNLNNSIDELKDKLQNIILNDENKVKKDELEKSLNELKILIDKKVSNDDLTNKLKNIPKLDISNIFTSNNIFNSNMEIKGNTDLNIVNIKDILNFKSSKFLSEDGDSLKINNKEKKIKIYGKEELTYNDKQFFYKEDIPNIDINEKVIDILKNNEIFFNNNIHFNKKVDIKEDSLVTGNFKYRSVKTILEGNFPLAVDKYFNYSKFVKNYDYDFAIFIVNFTLPYISINDTSVLANDVGSNNIPVLKTIIVPKQCESFIDYLIINFGDNESKIYINEKTKNIALIQMTSNAVVLKKIILI